MRVFIIDEIKIFVFLTVKMAISFKIVLISNNTFAPPSFRIPVRQREVFEAFKPGIVPILTPSLIIISFFDKFFDCKKN